MKRLASLLVAFICVYASATHAQIQTNSEFNYFKVKPSLLNKYKAVSVDGKENKLSPLLKKVWDKLQETAIKEANKITEDIIDFNKDFALGESNFSGFNWTKPAGSVGIEAGRRVDPVYTQENLWVVTDKLTLTIDASTFLKKLVDEGDIDMNLKDLSAFAGVVFKRDYTYQHYADSYFNGLKSDFKKLFFSFLKFHGNNYLELEPHERVERQDYLSGRLGLAASTPTIYFVSAQGNLAISYSKLSRVSIHMPGDRDYPREDEMLRIGVQQDKMLGVSAQIAAQADFYKLLKLTLLSAEYSYDLSVSHRANFSFRHEDYDNLNGETALSGEVKKMLKAKIPDNDLILMPYILSYEDTINESESFNGLLMMWGKQYGSFTQDLTVRDQNQARYFFRHQTESMRINKSIFQFLLKSDKFDKHVAREVSDMTLEWEVESDQREIPLKDMLLNDPAWTSVRFSKEFWAKKTTGFLNGKFRKHAVRFIRDYTSLDPAVSQMIKNKELKGPLNADVHAQISAEGIVHLLNLDGPGLEYGFDLICIGKSRYDKGNNVDSKERQCIEGLEKSYAILRDSFQQSSRFSLWKLRNFLRDVSKKVTNFTLLRGLFGDNNLHINGTFSAKTKNGKDYVTYFMEGDFQGRGIIGDYLQSHH